MRFVESLLRYMKLDSSCKCYWPARTQFPIAKELCDDHGIYANFLILALGWPEELVFRYIFECVKQREKTIGHRLNFIIFINFTILMIFIQFASCILKFELTKELYWFFSDKSSWNRNTQYCPLKLSNFRNFLEHHNDRENLYLLLDHLFFFEWWFLISAILRVWRGNKLFESKIQQENLCIFQNEVSDSLIYISDLSYTKSFCDFFSTHLPFIRILWQKGVQLFSSLSGHSGVFSLHSTDLFILLRVVHPDTDHVDPSQFLRRCVFAK